jgi:hypothetical protein
LGAHCIQGTTLVLDPQYDAPYEWHVLTSNCKVGAIEGIPVALQVRDAMSAHIATISQVCLRCYQDILVSG